MFTAFENIIELLLAWYDSLVDVFEWILNAYITFVTMLTSSSVAIPLFFPLYLPSSLLVVFGSLVTISIVMAVLSLFGSSIRR